MALARSVALARRVAKFGAVAARDEALRNARVRVGRIDVRQVLIGLLIALNAFFLTSWLLSKSSPAPAATGTVPTSQQVMASLPGDPMGSQFEPLTADEAMVANSLIPVAPGQSQPGMSLQLTSSNAAFQTAAECLAAAIYYEAAAEPADGQRAVAQVVINRVHHPAYPGSICGVIFQGSKRATGCQFTFTCDGSLKRAPLPRLWSGAQAIALEALSGKVFEPVGLSTHYHADYVVPYWAKSLAKTTTIGRHIFYRWGGRGGMRLAFVQPYEAQELAPVALGESHDAAAFGEAARSGKLVDIADRPILDLAGQELDEGSFASAKPSVRTRNPDASSRFVIPMGEVASGRDEVP